jgi:hypothetical protein
VKEVLMFYSGKTLLACNRQQAPQPQSPRRNAFPKLWGSVFRRSDIFATLYICIYTSRGHMSSGGNPTLSQNSDEGFRTDEAIASDARVSDNTVARGCFA